MPRQLIVRRILRSDADLVRAVLRTAGCTWSRGELLDFLDDGLSSGLIAEDAGRPVGALLFRVRCGEMALKIVAFRVTPDWRRRGIGSALLHTLGRNLTVVGQGRIEALIAERNVAAQLFLRANGFRAVRIARKASQGEDAYLFERQYVKPALAQRR